MPQSAPGAAAGAATGPTWDQQHQAYVAGLNTEVKAALEAGKAYSNTADQMQRLRELLQQLRSAELAAAFAGDTKAVAELRRELIGVNAALGAPQLQSLIAYSEAFQKDTEAGIAGGVAQGDKYMQSWYGLRQQSAQTRNATIADPAARARAQLNAEIELKREELATVTDANGERKQLQDELDNWIVARDAQLAEQLKPQWQKNLDAWSDMTRGMRDRFDEFQLSIQQAGEQVAIAFGRTGHFSGQALVQAFEDEISKSIYRQYFAPLVSQASGAIGGAIFGQSGSADYFGGANFTYGFHTGGIVGSEGTARSIAAGAFAGAPRFHSGVGPGEMAAILKKDEGVFTPGQMRALGAGASRPTGVVVNLNNQSGVQLNAQASAPRMDGENMVVDLLIKRLSRDAGARDQVNSLLKAPT